MTQPDRVEEKPMVSLIPEDPRCPRCGKRFGEKVARDYPNMDRMEELIVVRDGETLTIHARCKLPRDEAV